MQETFYSNHKQILFWSQVILFHNSFQISNKQAFSSAESPIFWAIDDLWDYQHQSLQVTFIHKKRLSFSHVQLKGEACYHWGFLLAAYAINCEPYSKLVQLTKNGGAIDSPSNTFNILRGLKRASRFSTRKMIRLPSSNISMDHLKWSIQQMIFIFKLEQ